MRRRAINPGRPYWRKPLWGAILALLLMTAAAVLFVPGFEWTAFDFAAAILLLIGGGLLFEAAMRLTSGGAARVAAGGAVILALALCWAQGAVGIF
jgi:hypothetical protein